MSTAGSLVLTVKGDSIRKNGTGVPVKRKQRLHPTETVFIVVALLRATTIQFSAARVGSMVA
eukprot:scaffold10892_cov163-Amphora_coffeaeformis.AAC.7